MRADLYDLVHRGNPGDLEFYREICRGAGSVLELGCGSGRVLTALLPDVERIVGLDRDGGMLACLRERLGELEEEVRRRVRVELGDMTQFDLGERFDRVIVPYNGLLCLLDEAAVVSCLRCAARQLRPGGRLAFDFYNVDPADDPADGPPADEDDEPVVVVDWNEETVTVFEVPVEHPDPRRFDVTYRYVIVGRAGRREVRETIVQRCLYSVDIPRLLEQTGFDLEEMLGDFDGPAITEKTEQVAVVAVRPSGKPLLREP